MKSVTKKEVNDYLDEFLQNLNHKFNWYTRKIKTDSIMNFECLAMLGHSFYKVYVYNINDKEQTATIEFLEPINKHYVRVMHNDFKNNKCFNFPWRQLCNFTDNIDEVAKESNKKFCARLFWKPDYWYEEERYYTNAFNCKIVGKHNPNKHNPFPWIVVEYEKRFGSYHDKSFESFKIKRFGKQPIFTKDEIHKTFYVREEDKYLDSLSSEKECSASFWSLIKKNLEVIKNKPMKRIRKTYKVLIRQKGISQFIVRIEGDVDLSISKEGGKFYNTKPIYNKAKGMYPKAKVMVIGEVDDIITQLKKNYTPPKTRTFQVSYTVGKGEGLFLKNGTPRLQVTKTVHGISYKSALRRYKINLNSVLWAKEIVHTLGMAADPKVIPLYERKERLTKLEKRRRKIRYQQAERKLDKIRLGVKAAHDSDRLVCIGKFEKIDKVIIDVKKVKISKTKDGTYDMTEWHYIPKSTYKNFTNTKEYIKPPEINQEKRLKKQTYQIEKNIKRVKLTHEKELNQIRLKSKKGYYTFRTVGEKNKEIRKYYSNRGKRKSGNNRDISRKVMISISRQTPEELALIAKRKLKTKTRNEANRLKNQERRKNNEKKKTG